MSSNTALIYGLVDPRDGVVRYVGKTVRNPKSRLRGHINRAKQGSNHHVSYWILDLIKGGSSPRLVVIRYVVSSKWKESEKFWISYFKDRGFDLLNMTVGGGGTKGCKHTLETRRKLSLLATRQWSDPNARERNRQRALIQWSDVDFRMRKSVEVKASMTPERRKSMSDFRRDQWANDKCYRDKVVASQQLVDRSIIAKSFWQRSDYRSNQSLAWERRHAAEKDLMTHKGIDINGNQ